MSDEYTKKVLIEMLTESTGVHMLDSGGAYGRNWQRNRQRLENDPNYFDKQPAVHLTFDKDGVVDASISLYQYLLQYTEADVEWNSAFADFNAAPEWKYEPWEDVMEAFCKKNDLEVVWSEQWIEETILTQAIHWWEMRKNGDSIVAIRAHGGCDYRGGWGRPWFFVTENGVLPMPEIELYCEGAPPEQLTMGNGMHFDCHRWTTEAGRFVGDGGLPDLSEYDYVYIEEWAPGVDCEPKPGVFSVICGQPYCPICGGKLGVYIT